MEWCKGDGDHYTIHRRKDHRKSFWRKCERLRPMYIMTRDGFTLLAMGMTGSKAMKFKIVFIEQFKKYESAVKSNTFGVPQSLSEALLMAANQAKQIEEQHRTICQQSSVIWLSEETIKKQVISRPEGDNLIRNTTKITPKGQIYLYNKLMEEGGRK